MDDKIGKAMNNETGNNLDRTTEDILAYQAPDEALEHAAGGARRSDVLMPFATCDFGGC